MKTGDGGRTMIKHRKGLFSSGTSLPWAFAFVSLFISFLHLRVGHWNKSSAAVAAAKQASFSNLNLISIGMYE